MTIHMNPDALFDAIGDILHTGGSSLAGRSSPGYLDAAQCSIILEHLDTQRWISRLSFSCRKCMLLRHNVSPVRPYHINLTLAY